MPSSPDRLHAPAPRLEELLRVRHGARDCIPVLGSGVNIQAACMEGHPAPDDWAALLQRILKDIGVSDGAAGALPGSNLARWESMLRLWARHKRCDPFKAEQELQQFVCEHLRGYESQAAGWRLYRELLDAGFADIISLNFDRSIARSGKREQFVVAPKGGPGGAQGETFFRHSVVKSSAGRQTRIWYPHGDTKKASTLKLGVRRYGFHLGALRELQLDIDESWRFKRAWHQWNSYAPLGRAEALDRSWVKQFLSRDLLFIGIGLSFDEWAMWTMLHARSVKISRGRGRAPQALYLHVGANESTKPVLNALIRYGVTPCDFANHGDVWVSLRAALSRHGSAD
jgi:hypothetical protein